MTKKIELRKVSYNASLSEETSAYTAQVWVDGVHLCDVSNHGTGGCDMQHPANGKTHDDVSALNAWIKSTFPQKDTGMLLKGEPFIIEQDLESVCGDLLSEHLISRDLQRTLKRTVAFIDPASGKVMTYKGKHEGVARAHLVTETLRKKPGAKILNNLPFAEALALYRSAA